jgi:hypothetical protein
MALATNNGGRGYDVGDVCAAIAVFYAENEDGDEVSIEPTTVACTFTPPTGEPVTYTYGIDDEATQRIVTDPETGLDVFEYLFKHPVAVAGQHTYKVTATGNGASVEKAVIYSRD